MTISLFQVLYINELIESESGVLLLHTRDLLFLYWQHNIHIVRENLNEDKSKYCKNQEK